MEFKSLPAGHMQLHAQTKCLGCNGKVITLFNHKYFYIGAAQRGDFFAPLNPPLDPPVLKAMTPTIKLYNLLSQQKNSMCREIHITHPVLKEIGVKVLVKSM